MIRHACWLLTILTMPLSATEWTFVVPRVTDATLNGIYFMDNYGWAVGDDGTTLKSNNGGASWYTLPAPPECDTFDLETVFFSDSLRGWICGEGGMLFKTEDGGGNWEKLPRRTNKQLTHLSFFDNTGWITDSDRLLLTTDYGHTWLDIIVDLSYIFGTSFVSKQTAWLYGYDEKIAITTDGGVHWRYLPTPSRPQAISASDDTTCWVALSNYPSIPTIAFTRNAGETWTQADLIDTGATAVNDEHWHVKDMHMSSSTKGWVLAEYYSQGNYLFTTDDGGESWHEETDFPTIIDEIDKIHADRDGNIWLVGQFGMIITNRDLSTRILSKNRSPLSFSPRGTAMKGFYDLRGRRIPQAQGHSISLRVDTRGSRLHFVHR
ncbi:MAG: hypothetical protein GF344_01060 [Chitinivibrionales bacterium]|nr:hypothetical protein [Chitinivibrionales bacterium]